jgi:hypothetical protein
MSEEQDTTATATATAKPIEEFTREELIETARLLREELESAYNIIRTKMKVHYIPRDAEGERSIMHIRVGSPMWEPSAEELERVAELFAQADREEHGAVVATRFDVEVVKAKVYPELSEIVAESAVEPPPPNAARTAVADDIATKHRKMYEDAVLSESALNDRRLA